MKRILLAISTLSVFTLSNGQDWKDIPVPDQVTLGTVWELDEGVSDDFNYNFDAQDTKVNFGGNRWYNFYHNQWNGPGTTYWKYNHVSVDGSDLLLTVSRYNKDTQTLPKYPYSTTEELPEYKMDKPDGGVNAGCITSKKRVLYPVFVEAKVSVADIALASDVWLLSPDDTQEIDVIECYGGAYSGNTFAHNIHLSHHSFIRSPFADYQPRDQGTWFVRTGVSSWGQYCWNDGERQYVRIGVNWIGPKHFEYYVDGELERVLYDKAVATKRDGVWNYQYPTLTNGVVTSSGGYQILTNFATQDSYSLETLKSASDASSVSIVDPYGYQGEDGFTKELDIIINIESQDWLVTQNITPTDEHLSNPAQNTMKVDWIRVYKPEGTTGDPAITETVETVGTDGIITIEAEDLTETDGSFVDQRGGAELYSFGFNVVEGSNVNWVNTGDWGEYPVNIPEDGAYELVYEASTPMDNVYLTFSVDGTIINSTDIPNNGEWDTWQTIKSSHTIDLDAGKQILRITSEGNRKDDGGTDWGCNIDKFTLKRVGDKVAVDVNTAEVSVYPNPFEDYIYVQAVEAIDKYEIYNINGVVVNSGILVNSTINTSDLVSGVYILKVYSGETLVKLEKIIK